MSHSGSCKVTYGSRESSLSGNQNSHSASLMEMEYCQVLVRAGGPRPSPAIPLSHFDTFLTVSISFWGIFTYPPTTSWLVLSPCVILRFLRGSLNGPVDHPLLLTGSSLEVALLIYNQPVDGRPMSPVPPLSPFSCAWLGHAVQTWSHMSAPSARSCGQGIFLQATKHSMHHEWPTQERLIQKNMISWS